MAKRFYITRVKDVPPPPPPTLVAYRVKDRRTGETLATFAIPNGGTADAIKAAAFAARDRLAEAIEAGENYTSGPDSLDDPF